MTKINQKKCTIYLQSSDGIDYSVEPSPAAICREDNVLVYEFIVDINCISLITFTVLHRHNNAHMQIKKVLVNNIEINNLNTISYLRTQSGEIRKNHGYIDDIGEFVIKIHTNAVSQNYLNYLLSLTK